MNRIRKYVEQMADGQELRTAYTMTLTALPDPRPRSRWQEVGPFNAAEEVLGQPELKPVYKAAIKRGFSIVAGSDV